MGRMAELGWASVEWPRKGREVPSEGQKRVCYNPALATY